MSDKTNHALEAVKEYGEGSGAREVTLSTGVRAIIKPVPPALVEDARRRLKPPRPPLVFNAAKEREEPNPHDPDYQDALREHADAQGHIILDTIVLFGIELVEGVPEGDGWLKDIRMMERLGHLDLSAYDLKDSMDREYLYKRYVALGSADFALAARLSRLTPEGVEAASAGF